MSAMIIGLTSTLIAFPDSFGVEDDVGMSDEITVQVNGTSTESETEEESASEELSPEEDVSLSDEIETEIETENMDDSMMEDVIDTPRSQVENGVAASDVECKADLELVLKATNGMPACVSPSTAMKLIERGWAMSMDTMTEEEMQ